MLEKTDVKKYIVWVALLRELYKIRSHVRRLLLKSQITSQCVFAHHQSDKLAGLVVHFLAIYNIENLFNSIQKTSNLGKKNSRYKNEHSLKIAKDF